MSRRVNVCMAMIIKSLRVKMLLLILGISAAVFIPTIVFITSRNHRDAVANARERSLAQAEVLVERVQN